MADNPASPVTDSDIFEALEASKGNLAEAAKNLGLRRGKLKERVDASPALISLLDDLREGIIDRAEQNRFADVEKGDAGASNFILQTIGKGRGYSTGVAGTGKDGAIIVEVRRFTDEETA